MNLSALPPLAQTTFAENNVEEAFRYLDQCSWDLRGWEHRHLSMRFKGSKQTLKGHTDRVISVAFGPRTGALTR